MVQQKDGSVKKIPYPEYMSGVAPQKVDVSLVVPAYNEEKRLPVMLKETIEVSLCFFLNTLTFIKSISRRLSNQNFPMKLSSLMMVQKTKRT